MSWSFLHPNRLWLLFGVLALAGLYVLAQVRRRHRAVKFTNIELLDSVAPRRPAWRRHLVSALTLGGLAIGVFALAQPFRLERSSDKRSTIMVVLDVSLSMMATDVTPSRLEGAKSQATKFVQQIDPSIDVGLVSFSKNVRVRVSPTLDRPKVIDAIDRLGLEEGTAIGDAIIETTDAIVSEYRDRRPAASTDTSVPGADSGKLGVDGPPAAIVLLTDGETVKGLTPGPQGAKVAAAAGIPVFGIAFGTPQGVITVNDPIDGPVTDAVPVKYDELTEAAKITGGQFYKAESSGDLANVYKDIQAHLEPALKQPAPKQVELTIQYLAAALLLLAIAVALGQWWLGGIT